VLCNNMFQSYCTWLLLDGHPAGSSMCQGRVCVFPQQCTSGALCCNPGEQACGGTCCNQACLQNRCLPFGSTICGANVCSAGRICLNNQVRRCTIALVLSSWRNPRHRAVPHDGQYGAVPHDGQYGAVPHDGQYGAAMPG
jgi:hypothetical protein